MSPRDLDAYGIYEGKTVNLEFEGGIRVYGEVITGTRDLRGKILLISFMNCTVSHLETILFQSGNGIYDMAVGKEIVSAFSGAADVNSFLDTSKISETKTQKITYSDKEKELYKLYEVVRYLRENKLATEDNITQIFTTVKKDFAKDWLLLLELYELAKKHNFSFQSDILNHLEDLKKNKELKKLITNGLNLLN